MSAVAHTSGPFVRPTLVATAVVVLVAVAVLAAVLLAAPWRDAVPAASTSVGGTGGAVAVCPELPVSPC
jgi:hypothetical protein